MAMVSMQSVVKMRPCNIHDESLRHLYKQGKDDMDDLFCVLQAIFLGFVTLQRWMVLVIIIQIVDAKGITISLSL